MVKGSLSKSSYILELNLVPDFASVHGIILHKISCLVLVVIVDEQAVVSRNIVEESILYELLWVYPLT